MGSAFTSFVSFLLNINNWGVLIFIFFIIEFFAKLFLNLEHQIGVVEEQDMYGDISSEHRSTAIAVASLVFAGIAIIFSEDPSEYVSQVQAFVIAFGFLLTSVFAHELTWTKRVYLTFQEMTLEYGLLFMAYGLLLLVIGLNPQTDITMYLVFFGLFLFRMWSAMGELRAHYNQ